MPSRILWLATWNLATVASVASAPGCQKDETATDGSSAALAGGDVDMRGDIQVPPDAVRSTPGPAPLSASAAWIQLPLRGYGPATVALPLGATEKRPVVVALHAHATRPEHACTRWQRAADGWPFVLCPWGLPATAKASQTVTLGSADYTEREIVAGLSELREAFGAYVSDGPPLLVGWSLGAEVAVELAGRDGARYERMALGEGAYADIEARTAARLRAAGVRRVLLVCSTLPCETSYSWTLDRLERAGVASHVSGAGNGEHPFDGPAVRAAARGWPWLVEGDPRFAQE
jgi:pimeloyl-ACP methyl ester carboxylesterase